MKKLFILSILLNPIAIGSEFYTDYRIACDFCKQTVDNDYHKNKPLILFPANHNIGVEVTHYVTNVQHNIYSMVFNERDEVLNMRYTIHDDVNEVTRKMRFREGVIPLEPNLDELKKDLTCILDTTTGEQKEINPIQKIGKYPTSIEQNVCNDDGFQFDPLIYYSSDGRQYMYVFLSDEYKIVIPNNALKENIDDIKYSYRHAHKKMNILKHLNHVYKSDAPVYKDKGIAITYNVRGYDFRCFAIRNK